MDQKEFIDTVRIKEGKVSLSRNGISVICRHVADGLNMMQLITKDDDILVSVPYDDVEKMNDRGDIIFSYNGCMRAVMNCDKVVKLWDM